MNVEFKLKLGGWMLHLHAWRGRSSRNQMWKPDVDYNGGSYGSRSLVVSSRLINLGLYVDRDMWELEEGDEWIEED